jgi:hypothetical protein
MAEFDEEKDFLYQRSMRREVRSKKISLLFLRIPMYDPEGRLATFNSIFVCLLIFFEK